MSKEQILKDIQTSADPKRAMHHLRFFKTGKGEYGEGDLFYGLKVPQVRQIAKQYYKETTLLDVCQLISHPYHEVRLAALVILLLKNQKATQEEKKEIFNCYLNNVNHINNWDLVDISAPRIAGGFLFDKDRGPLWQLAHSDHLWSERISVLATFYFIKHNDFNLSLELAEHFLSHKHDLMHKAVGWMLREIGKKDLQTLYTFLDQHYQTMPRTMLRYSLEKIPPEKRKLYMAK
jgi:3-methyladenine DNA glycosylase AlkD